MSVTVASAGVRPFGSSTRTLAFVSGAKVTSTSSRATPSGSVALAPPSSPVRSFFARRSKSPAGTPGNEKRPAGSVVTVRGAVKPSRTASVTCTPATVPVPKPSITAPSTRPSVRSTSSTSRISPAVTSETESVPSRPVSASCPISRCRAERHARHLEGAGRIAGGEADAGDAELREGDRRHAIDRHEATAQRRGGAEPDHRERLAPGSDGDRRRAALRGGAARRRRLDAVAALEEIREHQLAVRGGRTLEGVVREAALPHAHGRVRHRRAGAVEHAHPQRAVLREQAHVHQVRDARPQRDEALPAQARRLVLGFDAVAARLALCVEGGQVELGVEAARRVGADLEIAEADLHLGVRDERAVGREHAAGEPPVHLVLARELEHEVGAVGIDARGLARDRDRRREERRGGLHAEVAGERLAREREGAERRIRVALAADDEADVAVLRRPDAGEPDARADRNALPVPHRARDRAFRQVADVGEHGLAVEGQRGLLVAPAATD